MLGVRVRIEEVARSILELPSLKEDPYIGRLDQQGVKQ
jgi:hypothetical protein